MINVNQNKERSPRFGLITGIGCLAIVGSGIAYQLLHSRPIEPPMAEIAPPLL
ncbi:MAG: hypothetical protein KME01_09600 [Chroococcus sp. CMT-3BRIN-NPC107]|jgi:hypothetical protein|nr:hypothetical protein [Chroococcus sp. CMT-3BRIN-NPC107]